MNPMPQFAISLQVAVFIGAAVGFIVYHLLWKKKAEQSFQKGVSFGLKEGFEAGFPQGVVLTARNLRAELKQIGVIVDKDINISPDTRPGLYKIQTLVEVKFPGQDSVLETPAPADLGNVQPIRPGGES